MKPGRIRETDGDRMLVHVGRTIWENLPQLSFASVLLLIAACPALFLATGNAWPLAWPVFVLCAGPVWMASVITSGRLLDGDAVTVRSILSTIRRHAREAIVVSIVPAAVGAILAGSFVLFDQNRDAEWLAAPLLLGFGIALAVCVALVGVFTIAAERGAGGLDLWLASVGVAITRPMPVFGTLTLFGMVAWVTAVFGPVALIGLAPLAILCSAVTRESMPGSNE